MSDVLFWSVGYLTKLAGTDQPLQFGNFVGPKEFVTLDLWEALALRARRVDSDHVRITGGQAGDGLGSVIASVLVNAMADDASSGIIIVGSPFAPELEGLRWLYGGNSRPHVAVGVENQEAREFFELFHIDCAPPDTLDVEALEAKPSDVSALALNCGALLSLNLTRRLGAVQDCLTTLLSQEPAEGTRVVLTLRVGIGREFTATAIDMSSGAVPDLHALLGVLHEAGWVCAHRSLGPIDLDYLIEAPEHEISLLYLYRSKNDEIPRGFRQYCPAVSGATGLTNREGGMARGRNLDALLGEEIRLSCIASSTELARRLAFETTENAWEPGEVDWAFTIPDYADIALNGQDSDSTDRLQFLLDSVRVPNAGLWGRVILVGHLRASGYHDQAAELAMLALAEAVGDLRRLKAFVVMFETLIGVSFREEVGPNRLRVSALALLTRASSAEESKYLKELCFPAATW